jgi:hypothetical protein
VLPLQAAHRGRQRLRVLSFWDSRTALRRLLPSRRSGLLRRAWRDRELRCRQDLRPGGVRQRVSAERFFDDLARTLAEPMPRRRAVRVIGASLAAIAVPGISPRMAYATTQSRSQAPVCPRGELCCSQFDANGKVLQHNRCGYPIQRYQCSNYKCIDTCPPTNRVVKNPDGTPKRQQPTWSSAKYPSGSPKRYTCCVLPDTIPHDGECLPNCKKVLGPNAIQCGKYCCPPGHRCKGNGQCIPCPRGQEGCGSTCCAAGKECTNCIERGNDISPGGFSLNGAEKCCAANEKCCRNRCCKFTHNCCGGTCCPPDQPCAASGGRNICCPRPRVFIDSGDLVSCCPVGTVGTRKGCCPPGDSDCCPPRDNLGNVLSCASLGRICVNGACVKP